MNTEFKILNVVESGAPRKEKTHFYDVFLGQPLNEFQEPSKIRSVGTAFKREGIATFILHLRTFPKQRFYLLPCSHSHSNPAYSISIRKPSLKPDRKYDWSTVGEANLLSSEGSQLLNLRWDLFDQRNIYLNLNPIDPENKTTSLSNCA